MVYRNGLHAAVKKEVPARYFMWFVETPGIK
jgi:hypothetical protein